MQHNRLAAVIGAAALTAAGLGALNACGSAGPAPGAAATPAASAPAAAAIPSGSAYDYYQSMMGRLYSSATGSPGSMMGGSGSYGWMMGGTGYRWMMGGTDDAPAWMSGSALPGFMMGTSRDPGRIMGTLFAGAPGPRVTSADATRLGSKIPASATISQAQHKITFSGGSVRLTIVASPPGGPDETFRAAGMVNPAIAVTPGARVSIQVINADPDTAHGLVVTASTATSSWMPMMTARPAFPGSALWFLGNPTPAGMHAGTLTFTASTPGTYRYLCPVPGHAQKGMTGTFTVGPS